MQDINRITTTADAAHTAVPNFADTSEQDLATSVALMPRGTSEINGASTGANAEAETPTEEVCDESEWTYVTIEAQLCSNVPSVFRSIHEDFEFEMELRKAFPVDLPGCDNIALGRNHPEKLTITLPIRVEFRMEKTVADLLSDEDISSRVEYELKRLADKLGVLPGEDIPSSYLLRGVCAVLIGDIVRE